jgi:DNA repair exonuclease SbcCD nuclease subunit
MSVRILFLSDTHLGIDLPSRPRGDRRRRGDDFFDAFELALAPSIRGETDLVVHGGDLFYRSLIPAWLAERVFSRLADLADTGVDIFWVAGNHERSGVPRSLFLTHPRIRVFDRPRTFVVEREGLTISFSGIPYAPRIRTDFPALLFATGHEDVSADVKLLCLHQAVEGATVGPGGFVFRGGDDVLRGRDIPSGFAAVLVGHIHRSQVLVRDLAGRPLGTPVLYAGSTERTSFAERDDPKGVLMLTVDRDERADVAVKWDFRELSVRPMVVLEIDPVQDAQGLEVTLRQVLSRLDPRSVVRIRLLHDPPVETLPLFRAAAIHSWAPLEMDVTFAWPKRGVRS